MYGVCDVAHICHPCCMVLRGAWREMCPPGVMPNCRLALLTAGAGRNHRHECQPGRPRHVAVQRAAARSVAQAGPCHPQAAGQLAGHPSRLTDLQPDDGAARCMPNRHPHSARQMSQKNVYDEAQREEGYENRHRRYVKSGKSAPTPPQG